MAQKAFVLPMRCEQCSTVFDLWYDLQEQEKVNRELGLKGFEVRQFDQSMCWRCRSLEASYKQEEAESDLLAEEEYELTIDFE